MKLLFIHSELLLVFSRAEQTLVCQNIKFSIPWQEKEEGGFDAWMWFVQVTSQEFTAVLALKSSVIVYDGQFKIIRLQPVIICA